MPSSGQLSGYEEREPISPAGEEWSSTHKRGVTPKTSGNPRPEGRRRGQYDKVAIPALFPISNRPHSLAIIRIVSSSRGGACPTDRGSTPYRGTPLN